MFGWIRDWWQARKYRQQRELFEFWDGQRLRRIDPWRAIRELTVLTEAIDMQAAADGLEPHTSQACEAIASILQVPRFDGTRGMTDAELVGVIDQLFDLAEGVKKKPNPGLISPRCTGGTPSETCHPATTSSHSDSGHFAPTPSPNGSHVYAGP